MLSGKIMLSWDCDGKLAIKTSLPLASAESKKLLIQVLLDAAKSVNDMGTGLVKPAPAPVTLLGNAGV